MIESSNADSKELLEAIADAGYTPVRVKEEKTRPSVLRLQAMRFAFLNRRTLELVGEIAPLLAPRESFSFSRGNFISFVDGIDAYKNQAKVQYLR
ncbi:hypothetical protein FAZ95_35985 [Trinickia violacea]|uniref:Uncharacterized protein n=1 Tax=Trinickia violacea TaxID=2571746 RepID=A0A4P8IYD9_9BURK|nr:hypothetical protein [Trinickia violacea]QCP54352.1 hypothetical protein FAZ95_35985 [Trinickia violacea]